MFLGSRILGPWYLTHPAFWGLVRMSEQEPRSIFSLEYLLLKQGRKERFRNGQAKAGGLGIHLAVLGPSYSPTVCSQGTSCCIDGTEQGCEAQGAELRRGRHVLGVHGFIWRGDKDPAVQSLQLWETHGTEHWVVWFHSLFWGHQHPRMLFQKVPVNGHKWNCSMTHLSPNFYSLI